MKSMILALTLVFAGCSDDAGNGTNNQNSRINNANNQNNEPCPELDRPNEMWIKVTREDGKQMSNLDATLTFENGEEIWKCSEATPDGILCDARTLEIFIVAKEDARGTITEVEITDPDGFTFSGPLEFEATSNPVSPGCSNTYQRSDADVVLAMP